MLVDTHAHLSFENYEGKLDDVIDRARHFGVEKIISIGAEIQESKESILIASKYPNVWATVGVHPEISARVKKEGMDVQSMLRELEDLTKNNKVVAIGEIGLDYHYPEIDKDIQRELFEGQIEIARRVDKPIVVHVRDCGDEAYEILKEKAQGLEFVVHCFSGDWEMAKKYLDLGAYISFTGIVTFGDAKLEEIVKNVPADRYMVETDCPFLAPVPKRGQENEPAFTKHVAEKVAEIRGETLSEVAENTTKNAENFFGI